MRYSNITKMDSKGRILIPSHIRKTLGLEKGTEVVLIPDNEKTQAKLLPLMKDKTAEFKIVIDDVPGSLAKVAEIMALFKINIIISQSRTIVKGRLAEWDIIADISECNGKIEDLKEKLLNTKVIKKMDIVRI